MQCPVCGRFCRVVSQVRDYNGAFVQLYVTTDCARCGVHTEGVF